jgi:hypothetical protein
VNVAGRSRGVALGLSVLFAHGACSITGTYEPRPSRRITQLDGGGRVYVRDGRRFELGLTGSAVELVSGNDLAVDYAHRYRRRQIAGLTCYAVGLAAALTGIALLAVPDRSDGRTVAGNVLLGTSLVPMTLSLPFIFTAHGRLQDAVNIYNDGLEGPLAPDAFEPRYTPPPPGGR